MNRTLEDRVARLERANRWLVLVCAGLVVLPMLAIVGWNATQDEQKVTDLIRARKFELVDGDGRTRVRLDTTDDQVMRLLNREGRTLASLYAAEESAGIIVFNPEGGTLAALGGDGSGSMLILDHPESNTSFVAAESGFGLLYEGKTRAEFEIEYGEPILRFFAKDREEIYRIPPDKP
ncbi:MAG: hypothetical protein IH851_05230 [Armatimonadetes bacterium]|nr:hypothetical protein [Armatimonadota bacterium]